MSQQKKSLFGLNNTRYPSPSPDGAKIVAACVVTAVMELLLMTLGKYYAQSGSFAFVRGLTLVLTLVFVAGFAYFCVCMARAGGKPADLHLYTAAAVVCLGLAATFLILRLFWTSGLRVLYVLWAGAGVLYILNQIYHREFIFLAGLTGLAALAAFVNYRVMGYGAVSSASITVTVVLIAAALFVAVMTLLASRHGGVAPFLGQKMTVYVIPSSKVLLYVTSLVTILCAAAALALGAAFCYYCFFVALAWLILSADYYTIRLM